MTLANIWSWGMVIYGVTGMYLAGNKKVLGWSLGISAQVLWVGFAFIDHKPAFVFSALAYGSVFTRNLLRWRRERPEPVTLPATISVPSPPPR